MLKRIELHERALQENVGAIARKTGDPNAIAAVVKSNAYGHGAHLYVQLLQNAGIGKFCFYSANEVLDQDLPPDIRCIMLGPIQQTEIEELAIRKVELSVTDQEQFELFVRESERIHTPIDLHWKIDTGLNRLGTSPQFLADSLMRIANHKYISLRSVYSHLANVGDLVDLSYSDMQANRLWMAVNHLIPVLPPGTELHLQSTGGIISSPGEYSFARIGLGLTGYWPNDSFYDQANKIEYNIPDLKPVLSLKAAVHTIKSVKAGEAVGYGCTFRPENDLRIGICSLGYGDGLPFGLPKQGYVLVNGRPVRLLGPVNMNSVILDLSSVPDCKPMTDAVFIGRSGEESIDFHDWAKWTGGMVYDLMAKLNGNITRIPIRSQISIQEISNANGKS